MGEIMAKAAAAIKAVWAIALLVRIGAKHGARREAR
jgi:hypothetical protein